MTPELIVEVFARGLLLVVVLVAVIILPSLLVGLFVSVLQAATQVNEQTLSFLPRLLAVLITVLLAGTWILQELMDLSEYIFRVIAETTQ